MNRFLAPSLARRLIFALVIAFIVAALVLVARDTFKLKDQSSANTAVENTGKIMVNALASITSAEQAVLFTQRFDKILEDNYFFQTIDDPAWIIQLFDRKGELIYATPRSGALFSPGPAGSVSRVTRPDHAYQVYSGETPQWSVRLAVLELNNLVALKFMAGWVLPDLLLSFPLLGIALWLAVTKGLQPLRSLSGLMTHRSADDLSPLDVDMKYVELKPVTNAFNALLEKLRRKVALERAFVQDAAHELRTPMAVIGAQAHVLAFAATSEERVKAKEALDYAIGRASHLTQQLLSLAALEHITQVTPCQIDVIEIIQNTLANMAPAAIARDVELSLDAPCKLVWTANPIAFQSVAQNLVDNALRYGYDGGQIAVTVKHVPEGLVLSVADDGPGIPPEERENVFERFYRGGSQEIAGTGLGLAIVKKAVLNMGGKVELLSGLNGRGACFVVFLPTPA